MEKPSQGLLDVNERVVCLLCPGEWIHRRCAGHVLVAGWESGVGMVSPGWLCAFAEGSVSHSPCCHPTHNPRGVMREVPALASASNLSFSIHDSPSFCIFFLSFFPLLFHYLCFSLETFLFFSDFRHLCSVSFTRLRFSRSVFCFCSPLSLLHSFPLSRGVGPVMLSRITYVFWSCWRTLSLW